MTTDDKDLLPCPFCKWPAFLFGASGEPCWVECSDCGAQGPPEDTREVAAEAWNTRPEAADRIEQLSSALTDARDAIASLEPDALGMAQIPFGTTGVDMYPIRAELLAKIVSALQSLQVGGE
jgi:hypothetical protein